MASAPGRDFDVVLHLRPPALDDGGLLAGSTLVGMEVRLTADLSVARLHPELADEIIRRCTPAAAHGDPAAAPTALYGFVRRHPASPPTEWDPGLRLASAIALSRIVHPTTTGFRYAAQVRFRGGDRIVTPAGRVWGATAYVVHPELDWLTTDHVAELRALLEAGAPDALPPPLHAALADHERLSYQPFVGTRWPLLVNALERLVTPADVPRPPDAEETFARRLGAIAARLSFGMGEAELREAYRQRGAPARERSVDALEPEERRLYMRAEGLLRAIVRAALLDPACAASFRSGEAARAARPA